ncbi:MAG TPA: hypothetical protein VH415_09685 [Nitrososphaeraceae archaeon]
MVRNIPSFKIAAEIERAKWSNFRALLSNMKYRKSFDQLATS